MVFLKRRVLNLTMLLRSQLCKDLGAKAFPPKLERMCRDPKKGMSLICLRARKKGQCVRIRVNRGETDNM